MMTSIPKAKTGITGLDEITEGGLPKGRPTLLCGGPGCGKTLMAMEFLVKGVKLFNEPGVFMAFEEKAEELTANVASLGFDLAKLQRSKKLRLDYVHIDRSEIEETGEYDLNGLFIRLEHAIESVGAKRVVLDTIENLFAGLTNQGIIRAELRRLFRWLKDKGLTAIVTGERGDGMLTRQGLEEYVSDCVILLDHRIIDQISTRRLRIVKYRGSIHGTNEYPFLIDDDGITVLPVTSLRLDKKVSSKRVSTGITSLDEMFGGKGFFKGSSVLVSGSAGTGKTSIAAHFADATCRSREKCMYFAFEESPQQIIRNMMSIGLSLDPHINKGLLAFHSFRPGLYGLEMHLSKMYKLIKKFKPQAVVLDPITNLASIGLLNEVNSMLLRLIDHVQNQGITLMLTALNSGSTEHIDENVSSLVDTWLLVRDVESDGERNRALYIMKARGMKHSKEVREFVISSNGLRLVNVFRGPEGILVGSAREKKEKEAMMKSKQNGRGSFKASAQKSSGRNGKS
jgi:circadian clock protein KaiC